MRNVVFDEVSNDEKSFCNGAGNWDLHVGVICIACGDRQVQTNDKHGQSTSFVLFMESRKDQDP